jgi:hypothetical protein
MYGIEDMPKYHRHARIEAIVSAGKIAHAKPAELAPPTHQNALMNIKKTPRKRVGKNSENNEKGTCPPTTPSPVNPLVIMNEIHSGENAEIKPKNDVKIMLMTMVRFLPIRSDSCPNG